MTSYARTLRLIIFTAAIVVCWVACCEAKEQDDASQQSAVTVIGLGHMGSVLAKTFLDHGLKLTVWNRTASKSEVLVAAGAVLARSPSDAIAASPITIFSLTNKAIVRTILSRPEIARTLKNHTIVDLSTGPATDARANAAQIAAAGGSYLDGGIMEYPRSIGHVDAVILYSGSATAFRAHERTLAVLAGAQRYLGEDPGAAPTAYLALWNYYFVALGGYLEGVALGQTAGVRVAEFGSLAATMTHKLGDALADVNRRINTKDYSGNQAPTDEYLDGFEQIRQAMIEKGLSHRGVDAMIGYVESAQKAGNGDKDIAILFRTIGGHD